MLTLVFNYAISGLDPFSYHLVNWLLHILNTSLVFLFIYKISGRKIFVAAFTSFIFGIHPMHMESGKDSLAMADAETLLKLEPSNNADFVLKSRGTLLFNRFKRYNEAIADFSRVIELNPKGEYFYNRSNCYFRMEIW